MDKRVYLHLASAGLTGLVIGVMVLFWSYPKLLVYLLLAIVAALSYGALYLILAARLDPNEATADDEAVPTTTEGYRAEAEAGPAGEPEALAPKRKRKRKAPPKTAAATPVTEPDPTDE